ncbi:tRNA uridine-5-carboxymethylaminomethyl(34) synthesis GTPase MnmE [uncultured Dubosiella sp.]|jgi:tRNA modification GTPase|uniref:tRNA uridine-5-carboxymethylaminomethyl(34) synthesis GTPase MnmE n=1 Tax=uncultured Dubosiella sp. TaxID=1937011 RepID=UPI00262C01F6|nr:tRNA uridine-5-carboxymethylaminomethyl(34) synthesis GTPase MnmE [uncultured Dubosiella sp.]
MFSDTIAAISTPLQEGAISIVRMSGEDALEIANKVFSKDLAKQKSHTISYGYIQENGQILDEVLVSVFRAPKTYTREDVVEINCHGGIYITRRILELLLANGARMAKPGEFTMRAFYHGRIDLSQAEAVEDMIEATSDISASLAINGIRGSVRRLLEPLIDDIMDIIANIEVNIDYPEYEDVATLTSQDLLPKTENWLKKLDRILERAQSGQIVKQGIDTVIIGRPNVGKSSLLNALLEEDKAIVTDIAGTTRDIVEGKIRLGSVQLNLIDTAGIREADDEIERIGIQKSEQKLREAQLVLLVLDGSSPLTEEDRRLIALTEDKLRLIVINKADLHTDTIHIPEGISISARNGQIEPLLDALNELYEQNVLKDEPVLSNERQIGLLKLARTDMIRAKEAMEMQIEPDLIEIDIMAAHDHLKEILGEVSREDLIDTLFSKFCLGK